jgi:hypothetical protein
MADNDDCQPCRSVVSMNYAEVHSPQEEQFST